MAKNRLDGISVVVTTYNGEKWIESALRSILEQRSTIPLEIIVVDDCSQDNTVPLIESIDDCRIKVVSNASNINTAASRNIGIAQSSFQWIAFNDQDDIWLPEKLAKQIQLLEEHLKLDGVAGGYARLCKHGKTRWSTRLLHKHWSPEHNPPVTTPVQYSAHLEGPCYIQSLLIKKAAIESIGGFRENLPYAYDPDIFFRLSERVKLGAITEPVFLYRLSEESITAPGKAKAKRFLSGFAFVQAANIARAQGKPEPDLIQFLSDHKPTKKELDNFYLNQGMRAINTKWVIFGFPSAVIEALSQFFTRPTILLGHIFLRLKWWL